MKVAVVCDWLVTFAGAERVLAEMLSLWPEADLFAVADFLPEEERGFLRGKRPRTTFIQGLPFARRKYRSYLPLMPLAIESLDLSGYDLVVSSSHAVAKGAITGPDQLHVSYIHTPMRYAWDMQEEYLRDSGMSGAKAAAARLALHYMRLWDRRSADGVDAFAANSRFVARRVMKCYRREARVIYPPVDTTAFEPRAEKGDFYLAASRLVPYKKMALIAEAFASMPDKKLVVIGDGPDMAKVRACAGGNVSVLGHQPDGVLREKMAGAKAFVFAAEEDFGIAPVEAQASGTPVIAYGHGGARETVVPLGERGATGLFFDEQTAEGIVRAVERFEREGGGISAAACRKNAERFSAARFRRELKGCVDELLAEKEARERCT